MVKGTSDEHRAKIRDIIAKHDPALLSFCDAARDLFDAKLKGLQVKTELGWEGLGELGPEKPPSE